MQKILITGASGFVGSFLVEEALKRGLIVYAGIRSSSSKQYLQDPRLQFLVLNFNDLAQVKAQLEKHQFDYVIHNAGVVKVNKKADFFKYNTQLTIDFATLLMKTQTNLKKFTYISSAAAYGPADNSSRGYIKEADTPQPIDTYGESKLQAENWLKKQANFPYLIVRPTGVYGPRETEIFTFFKAFSQGLEGHIGRTPQKMAFVYVKDLARLVLTATLSEITQRAYFVSDGNAYPTQALGQIAAKVLKKKPLLKINIPIGVVQVIATVGEGIGRLTGKMPTLNLEKVKILKAKNWQCDIAPLQNDFNFAPDFDFERGLTETINWYKANNWL
ncbi:MAG: NAD(P)-dependent oxidoreductase [Bacteroidota bacterium]